MSNINWTVLVPIIVYFLLMYIIGFYAHKLLTKASSKGSSEFMNEFMTGGRDTGGFVLAMTLVATYLSAGSFIGGPGTAYTYGLVWVFLSMTQMVTGYYCLSVLGKKFAIIARKTNCNTITDFLRERYDSKVVVVIASLSIIFFLTAAMAAQAIGASRLLQGATGLNYHLALIFFMIAAVVHTAIGGYKGEVLNDTLQGIVMTISTICLFVGVIMAGGGVSNIIQDMKAIDPGLISSMGVDPSFTTKPYVTSYWVLVGFATVGLPALSQRAMSYKDTQSLHQGIKYGTPIAILLLFGMHVVGAFGRVLVPGIESGDLVVPTLAVELFPDALAGLLLAGPLAAVMSTLDSQLLITIGAIANDLIFNSAKPEFVKDGKKTHKFTIIIGLLVGLVVTVIAANPPDLMVWLNLFATAGQISTFLWPTILGLYWKRANAQGAIASMVAGIGSYIYFYYNVPQPFGMHPIVTSLALAFAAFGIVSKITKPPSKEIIVKFWGI